MTDTKTVAEKLLQANAVKLNVKEPYTWASGWKSPIYCDNRKVLGFPYVRDFIKSELSSVIFERFTEAEALAGVRLHKQNFRRLVEHGGLVEGTGRLDLSTGGREVEGAQRLAAGC